MSRSDQLSRSLRTFVLAFAFVALGIASAAAGEPSSKAIDAAALVQFPAKPHSGFSLAIAHDGRIVYAKGYGFRDDGTPDTYIADDRNFYGMPVSRPPAKRAAADQRTIYEIGSVTKQFTAATVLLLSQEHRLGLDDPVSRYAPEFADPALTLRMLLTQRSGLPDLNTLAFLQRVRPLALRRDGTFDQARIGREIAALPRDFTPGERFEYSNSNYVVLGTIVERITGKPLQDVLNERIFAPLGMTRTAFARPAATDDVAVGYRVDEHGDVKRAYAWDLRWLGGAGAMTSTVEDLARWDIALGAHRVLQPGSLAEFWHGLDAGRGQGTYAMGWIEDAIGQHRYLWHNGEVGGFHALNVIFPEDDLAFAVLCNNQDAKPEFLVPGLAALYFPVGGLDRVLPHSGVVLVEASLAVALGALAIGIVAVVTLKRFPFAGAGAAVVALIAGFLLPAILGFVGGGIVALLPVGLYAVAVRFLPARTQIKKTRKQSS